MMELTEIIVAIFILIFSAIFHEIAHGWTAYVLGDPTAKNAGRLSFNPIKHLDPLGSVLIPLMLLLFNSGIILGWARPVPINPFNIRDKKFGSAKVAASGPLSNLILAIIFGLILRFNTGNIIPASASLVFIYIVQINLLLAVFNLIPVPPLDGSHILFSFFPRVREKILFAVSGYGMAIAIMIIFFFSPFIFGIVRVLAKLITGI